MEFVGRTQNVELDREGPAQKRLKVIKDGFEKGDAAQNPTRIQPLAEMFNVHKAIRRNLESLRRTISDVSVSSTAQLYGGILARIGYLKSMMDRHCRSEESVLCPALMVKLEESKKESYPSAKDYIRLLNSKHKDMEEYFDQVTEALRTLQKEIGSPKKSETDLERAIRDLKQEKLSQLVGCVYVHLDEEEKVLLPLFNDIFSEAEQGKLLVGMLAVIFATPVLTWTVRALSKGERIGFLGLIEKYSTEDQLAEIASSIAHDLSASEWSALCNVLPAFEKAAKIKSNPLVEITHINKAIRIELADLLKFTKHLDPFDDAQLKCLAVRFAFLEKMLTYRVAGEVQVLKKELEQRLSEGRTNVSELPERDDPMEARKTLVALQEKLRAMLASGQAVDDGRGVEKILLLRMLETFAKGVTKYMDDEETKIFPLIEKHFSVEDQDQLVRKAMALIPGAFLADLILWCLDALSLDEQERLLRNVLRYSPEAEFGNIAVAIARAVQTGEKSRRQWEELCLRVPQLQTQSKGVADNGEFADGSPINEILRVHKAIRIELQAIMDASTVLPESMNPNAVSSLAERCSFLRRMVHFHSKAEDSIVLPLVEKRVSNISGSYEDEHSDERRLFGSLAKRLENLQCSGDVDVAMSVYVVARTLRDDMMSHLSQEESHLWPLLVKNLTIEEQSEVVANIFGQMPAEILQEMLPWMIRVLSATERDQMMNHIFAVTGSTLFDKWLRTWFPFKSATPAAEEPEQPTKKDAEGPTVEEGAAVGLILLQGKEDVQRAMRLVAADDALSSEQKSRVMQSLLVTRWMKNTPVGSPQSEITPEERVKSYIFLPDGQKVLGCKHYQRRCKIRAKCCGKLFTCRLCHDAVSNHTMNRYQTEEVWCMLCDTLQPVSESCRSCHAQFAKYYCSICRLYDGNASRSIYHCHSCNVCRVGKGLGIDFFHCMKCNACLSLSRREHKCIEKVMESNCPICNNYLFSSTTPIKYLLCGHLMHQHCYSQYAKMYHRCPVCQKSLEDMSDQIARLNVMMTREPMPSEYRSARATVHCNDCQKESTVHFHFLYLRCAFCQSHNTELKTVEPNSGDHHR